MIAVATAILATIGALFSYMGGATQSNAGLFKNNAAIKKTEASNQWNYYQAKSSKQNLAELALALVAEDKKPIYKDDIERYKKEKSEIRPRRRSWKPSPPIGTTNLKLNCTCTTAGPRPRRPCRSPSHWLPSPCSPAENGWNTACSALPGSAWCWA